MRSGVCFSHTRLLMLLTYGLMGYWTPSTGPSTWLHATSAAKYNDDARLGGNSFAFVRLTLLDRGEVDWLGNRERGNGRHISDKHKMLKCCRIRLN